MNTVLLVTHTESSVFRTIVESITIHSRKQGWALHVITAADAAEAKRISKAWNADGCIVYAASPSGIDCRKVRWPMPTVLISPSGKCPGYPFTAHDSCVTGRIAARELAKLDMDSFAFASETPHPSWAEKRLATFRDAIREYGRDVNIFPGGNLKAWLRTLPKRCGIFAANDRMAEKIVATAKSIGIAIPDDMTVLGCDDDTRICEHAEISISSIRPDYVQCAMLAANMLSSVMEGKKTETCRMFGDVGVIHRASTRVTAYKSPDVSAALEYIRLNALSGISASDVLSRMKGSRRSAENAFRAATGHSIVEEIQAVRLVEVKRLLSNPMLKISAIAARAGYRSENFLTRLFKRETGMTPSEWRRSNT